MAKLIPQIVIPIDTDKALSKYATIKDVSSLFKSLMPYVKSLKPDMRAEVKQLVKKIEDELIASIKKTGAVSESALQLANKVQKELSMMGGTVGGMVDAQMLQDAFDALRGEMPVLKLETPQEVRDKLESLTGDERLDKSAIKGLEEAINTGGTRAVSGPGRGIQLYVDGSKKGLIQYLNLIPGVGVSFTFSTASGRNDLTINASATTSVLTVTGTRDDSNVTFTTVSEPAIVVINGASYRSTGGSITWSWAAGTLILSSPVGQGGDVYAIS